MKNPRQWSVDWARMYHSNWHHRIILDALLPINVSKLWIKWNVLRLLKICRMQRSPPYFVYWKTVYISSTVGIVRCLWVIPKFRKHHLVVPCYVKFWLTASDGQFHAITFGCIWKFSIYSHSIRKFNVQQSPMYFSKWIFMIIQKCKANITSWKGPRKT